MKKAFAFALAMLNGPLDDATMLPFLDGLVASGYEGVCFHPRDGLLVPYASRGYWQRLDELIGEAKKRGLEIWHYDEFPYPSGAFGGIIAEADPNARVRTLQFVELAPTPDANGLIDLGPGALLGLLRQKAGTDGWEDVSADCGPHFDTWVWGPWHNRYYTGAYNVHEELHERASADRATTVYLPTEPLDEDARLLAIKVAEPPGQKGGAGHVDITLPEVTDRFLEAAYRPLAEISRRHGLENTPIFQDEVTFHAPFLWNRLVESGLREMWGAEWKTRLAALHFSEGPSWEETRYEYRSLCARLFEENWFVRVAAWCRENGLVMTGHLAGEESVVAHWNFLGDAFASLSHFDIPGYDIISSTIPDDLNRSQELGIKIVQSSAFLTGRKTMMAEVFGANSFAADLQRNRSVLAWLVLHDMPHVFDHSTYSCALGLRKYDAPPVTNRFNPLDLGRPDLWAWHRWFGELLEEYQFAPDTLVLFPSASLARFQSTEWEQWRESAALLESWYHYAFAHSLDAILLPAERLSEVKVTPDGFEFDGRTYRNFWVPPVPSLHAATAAALQLLANAPGFCLFSPRGGQALFGAKGEAPLEIPGASIEVDEAHLIETGVTEFDQVSRSDLRDFSAPRTLLKSLRRNAKGEKLLVLQNPHDEPLEVACRRAPGEVLDAPLGGVSTRVEANGDGFRITLAPREIAVFHPETEAASKGRATQSLAPTSARWRCLADNHLSLKTGDISLQGHNTRPFEPAPVSSLWPLDLPYYLASEAVYGPPYSFAALPAPLCITAKFGVTLESRLESLTVAFDAESLPPGAQFKWDDVTLAGEKRDLYDRGTGVFPIDAALLIPGAHVLTIEAEVTGGAQGLLERPILTGQFLTREAAQPLLCAPDSEWHEWHGQTWNALGRPEGFGDFEYEFGYEVAPDQNAGEWQLELPPFIGAAAIEVNGTPCGISSWEPRRVALASLQAGQNTVRVRATGSWNNLFSLLNRHPQGLSAAPILKKVEA